MTLQADYGPTTFHKQQSEALDWACAVRPAAVAKERQHVSSDRRSFKTGAVTHDAALDKAQQVLVRNSFSYYFFISFLEK